MKELFLISSIPSWLILLAGVTAAALLFQQLLSLRQRLGFRQSSFLVFLRALVYGLLIFFLFGPSLIETRTHQLRRPLMVLVDSSQSMNFAASDERSETELAPASRLDMVKAKLASGEQPLIERLSRDYNLRLFRFGTSLEPIAPAALPQLDAQEEGTLLLETLQSAAQNAEPDSAIVVFTDGITNGPLSTLNDGAALPVPVFTVGVAESEAFVDIRVSDIRAPQFAFRGREFKLELTVQAYGFKGKNLPLYFNRGRNLITSRTLQVDSERFEQKVTLGFTPKELGPHTFSVSIPPQTGEQITQNNYKEFKVVVRRDKVRVLTLSGSPSWNYRFLRSALKQDPLIELVSFVFLRTPTDSVDVPDNRLSLIPFPIDDIFLEELKNFDIVFFDDFSHRAYFNPVYLEKVRDFVRDGGGFAMLGGARSFDNGGFAETALKEILPVELDGKPSYRTLGAVRPSLTPAGRAHPITRLYPDAKTNEAAWNKMPALTTFNQVGRVTGDTLLAANGDGASPGSPLLTIGRFGRGRVLAFMSDELWRWNFNAVGNFETPQDHLKLIRQSVRWLAQEPSFEQVQVVSLPVARPGEKMNIKLRVFKDDFTPATQAAVQLRVVGPDGEPAPLTVESDAEQGEYTAEYTPVKEGSYRVEAEATLAGKALGKARSTFSVRFPYGETDDGRPNTELLKRIAEVSGGHYIPIEAFNERALEKIAANIETHAPSQIIEQRQTPLWSTLWPFLLILAILSVEWWTRRTWGLI